MTNYAKYFFYVIISYVHNLYYWCTYRKASKNRCNDGSLYVHIPKTGGTAVQLALDSGFNGHFSIKICEKNGGQSEKIIVVTREPVSRFISIWKYAHKDNHLRITSPLFWVGQFKDLNKFVLSPAYDAFVKYHYFFKPQHSYLEGLDLSRHTLTIMRQETLSHDIYENFGISIPLANASPEIESKLSEQSLKKVQKTYKDDYKFYSSTTKL